MILNNQTVKRTFLGISVVLSIAVIILKPIIESTMIATPQTGIIPASILVLISSLLLMVSLATTGVVAKYTFLFTMLLLNIKEFLWVGSTISIILYVMLVISLFKSIRHKILNIIVIIDCVTKILLTLCYLTGNINYYGSFYYATPSIIGLFASLCLSIGIWMIVFNPTTE